MALATHVTNRYSDTKLTQLTNADDPSATSVDTAVLGYAVDDVEGDFISILGRAYDDDSGSATQAQDISIGIEGVVAKLMQRLTAGSESGRASHDQYLERLKTLRKRVVPKTNSNLQPTPDDRGTGRLIRPHFDRRKMDKFLPGHPEGERSWPDI